MSLGGIGTRECAPLSFPLRSSLGGPSAGTRESQNFTSQKGAVASKYSLGSDLLAGRVSLSQNSQGVLATRGRLRTSLQTRADKSAAG
jgi:hypothetical protein